MKQLTNNEGKKVSVPQTVYNELRKSFEQGIWSVIVTADGKTNCFILADNF